MECPMSSTPENRLLSGDACTFISKHDTVLIEIQAERSAKYTLTNNMIQSCSSCETTSTTNYNCILDDRQHHHYINHHQDTIDVCVDEMKYVSTIISIQLMYVLMN